MESIWTQTERLPEREPLPGSITVDTAVIGGGITGILTAYQLRRKGIEAVVLEARRVGDGQTKNTTAKITSQHGLIYHRLARQLGERKAAEYAARNEAAVGEYQRIVEELNISCGFRCLPSRLYTVHRGEALRRELAAVKRLGIQASLCQSRELPVPGAQCLEFPNQAQFHPLKFLKAVSAVVPVFEHTRARRVRGHCVETDKGALTARQIVFATHFPFMNFPGFYFARMHQERSYVLALEGPPELESMYYGIDDDGLSFRSAEGKLLLGGGAHRTGKSPEASAYGELGSRAREFWPDCRVTAAYSAQDCIPLDGVPYIGRFSLTRPYWYVATGFQKWGMTSAMAAAQVISEEISREQKAERTVFSPDRFSTAAIPSLGKEVKESGKGLLKEILYLPGKEFDRIAPGQGAVIRWCGKKRGAYKDETGKVYLVSVRCPHLGCQLEWNGDEKSWDCPCHGSRFDTRGNLLDNPAQRNLNGSQEISQ